MSATIYLVPKWPRASLAKHPLEALRVELYADGLFIAEPGERYLHKERLVFANMRHCSIARLIEEVSGLECPYCERTICRDVWHVVEIAAGQIARCYNCDGRFRLVDSHGELSLREVEAMPC